MRPSKFSMYLSLGFALFNFWCGSSNLLAFFNGAPFTALLWAALGIGLGVWCFKSYLAIRTQLRGY